MSSADIRYICQRAANAIIAELGPYRVSTDALQTINQFLDEFLVLLLTSSLSLDLSCIKATTLTLLSSTLGKNAIVEAELEVKTYTETESVDYDTYEKMRALGTTSEFPLQEALPLLRMKCFEFCTLADKDDQRLAATRSSNSIVILPIVAIYITTILEHMAEYILTVIAVMAEHEDTDYIRVKEVFLALIDDAQLSDLFQHMNAYKKIEKRAGAGIARSRLSTIYPSSAESHKRDSANVEQKDNGEFLELHLDDLDFDYEIDDEPLSSISQSATLGIHNRSTVSAYSIKSNITYRPISVLTNERSNYTINTISSKKAFKLFKKETAVHLHPPDSSIIDAIYDPDAPTLNFEELVRSGSTMRVSLTPNRLRSIEVKDLSVDEPPVIPWDRRSTSTSRLSNSHQRPKSPPPLSTEKTSRSLNGVFRDSGPALTLPKKSSSSAMLSKEVHDQPNESTKPAAIPNSDSQITMKHREADESALPTPKSSISSRKSEARPSLPFTEVASSDETKTTDTKMIKRSTSITDYKGEVKVLRRSSLSSRKSRENLRRQRDEHAKQVESLEIPVLPKPSPSNESLSSSETITSESFSLPTTSSDETEIVESPKSMGSVLEIPTVNTLKRKSNKSAPDLTQQSDQDKETAVTNKTDAGDKPLRPSSMVAQRAARCQSYHENYGLASSRKPDPLRQRLSTAGTVGLSIKAWDEKSKQTTDNAEPVIRRRSMMPQWYSGLQEEQQGNNSELPRPTRKKTESAVLDKILKFEQANSVDEFIQKRASYIPRRERFLMLQRDPNALEIKSSLTKPKVAGQDIAVQTDTIKTMPTLVVTEPDDTRSSMYASSVSSEPGIIESDEEWFLPEEEWEDTQEQEGAVVEWLLGEA
ncbi:uncharacterized protein BYT42DRAFT_405053 [Radiomyces spectabilis]|uniref:uncharacterized protein n=1 Tax=Radiomyces spectabilis TaxID=64574 RepID=UPI002220C8B7|nr:uncharacterized protein BYT42DRAFT_405053 [Radiomyces spectabilis]KAI8374453.1 hypothetical protein BYT42DRAFT_405053 [Radiomyces spectabilis]